MMTILLRPCDRVRNQADAYAHGELGVTDAEQLEGHIESCEACAAEVDQAERAVTGLRSLDFDALRPEFDDAEIDAMRAETMAAIARARVAAPSRGNWIGAAVAVAAAAAAITFALVGTPTAPVAETAAVAPVATHEVPVSFFSAGKDGTLSWPGEANAHAYRIVRSDSPSFRNATVEIVCDNQWTDPQPGRLVYYQVYARTDDCEA